MKHTYTLTVDASERLTREEARKLVLKILQIGQADAQESACDLQLSDAARDEATLAADLQIEITEEAQPC